MIDNETLGKAGIYREKERPFRPGKVCQKNTPCPGGREDTYRSMKRAEKKEKTRLKDEEWERRMRAEELEEEYDEIDGIEDADY